MMSCHLAELLATSLPGYQGWVDTRHLQAPQIFWNMMILYRNTSLPSASPRLLHSVPAVWRAAGLMGIFVFTICLRRCRLGKRCSVPFFLKEISRCHFAGCTPPPPFRNTTYHVFKMPHAVFRDNRRWWDGRPLPCLFLHIASRRIHGRSGSFGDGRANLL